MKLYPSWLKLSLYHIREFFWPLIDEDEEEASSDEVPMKKLKLNIANENFKRAYELKVEISESEESRRSGVESKAALFISTTSITTSVVVAANALTMGNSDNILAVKISVFISFILTVYTVRTVWFSVKAMARKGYHVMGFDDINIKGNEEEYHKALLISLYEKTRNNESVINEKVDNLVLAQEYYKRSIITICVYAFLVLIFCMFFKKSSDKDDPIKPKFYQIEQHLSQSMK